MVFKSTPPYSIIKKKEIRTGCVDTIYQLNNENLVLLTQKDKVDSLIFYDYKKWRKIYVYTDFNNSYYWRDNSIHELSNGKMVLQRFPDGFIIFNTNNYTIESIFTIEIEFIHQPLFPDKIIYFEKKTKSIVIYDICYNRIDFIIKPSLMEYKNICLIKDFGIIYVTTITSKIKEKERKMNNVHINK